MTPETIEAPILVVDDRAENRLALRAVLEPLGQPIVEASSGDEALRRLLGGPFAVILMDVQMPGLDGLETAALIRRRAATAHIPIIFVTALSREMHYVMKGYEHGAVDYLMKPLDPEILRTKVKCFVDLYLRGQLLLLRERQLVESERAQAEAVRAALLEKQVSAMVGHDLRNPLALVRVNAQLGARTATSCPHHARLFERILSATDRLAHLTEDLLDLTRARLGHPLPITREPLCFATHVRDLLEDFRSLHPSRTFELDAPERLEGLGDAGRLAQVLQNLVENALKYGAPESPILISLKALRESGSLELAVENDGPTVPAEKVAALFDPFTRLGDSPKDRQSLGLGLFIVQEVARAHGGEVRAEPRDGSGMRFVVSLPVDPGKPTKDSTRDEPATPRAAAQPAGALGLTG